MISVYTLQFCVLNTFSAKQQSLNTTAFLLLDFRELEGQGKLETVKVY